MSKENEKTVAVYEQKANTYLETGIKHDNLYIKKANSKREKLQNFIKSNIGLLPKGSKVFEIGSGDGTKAKYIKDLGYKVTGSDIADAFIKETSNKGVETIKFNVLKDEFVEKYSVIFCWRVFVHFTKEDVEIILRKIYNNLEEEGIVIFNVINREVKNVEEEWIDFSNEYHMGAERYYRYFTEKEINEIISKIGYQIQSFHKEGGENDNKWLVYILKKI